MFNRIIINNILGINNKVELNFIAGPKKKEKKETVIEIEPNINVNKVIGIIGPNASGKSSIIHSLLELRIFLAQYQIVETAKEKKDEKMLKYMSNRFLPERNLENLNEDSEITLEMYIPNGEIPGYYTYSLIYNNDRLNEKLFYRKKYKSKNQQLILHLLLTLFLPLVPYLTILYQTSIWCKVVLEDYFTYKNGGKISAI